MSQRFSTDVLVIGGGAAGLSSALNLAEHCRVTMLCKGGIESSASHWAQGGVAAVTNPADSVSSHAADTISAGAGLCNEMIVSTTVAQAPEIIDSLINWGVEFDQSQNSFQIYISQPL